MISNAPAGPVDMHFDMSTLKPVFATVMLILSAETRADLWLLMRCIEGERKTAFLPYFPIRPPLAFVAVVVSVNAGEERQARGNEAA